MTEEKSSLKKAIAGCAVVIGLVVSVLGLNRYFVNKEVYQAKCEAAEKRFNVIETGMQKSFKGIQNQIEIQRAYDEVYFWQKTVVQLTQALATNPNNGYLKVQLNNARTNLKEAERRLRQKQGR